MKNIVFAGFLLAVGLFACNNASSVSTANLKSDTFKVWGNCGMCKKTIEKSLKINGVSEANWDKSTKIIKVVYDPTLINLAQVQQKIAAVGYDNDAFKGDDNAYAQLPECCQYERK